MQTLLRPWRRVAVALAVVAAPLHAQVSWTDWTGTAASSVSGTLMFNSTPVGVTYSGPYGFAQLGCGTDYYVPNVYVGPGVPNAPPNCEIIGLVTGGQKTITFSQAVTNPLLALVSWNLQPTVSFSGPLQVIAQGCGFWGCGTMSASGNTLTTNGGEVHGTIQLLGSYTSITFTDASENWHGITVGAQSLSVSGVPEPSTLVLTAAGLVAAALVARRRRS